jgi:uncharacterized lipoprotein YmbA
LNRRHFPNEDISMKTNLGARGRMLSGISMLAAALGLLAAGCNLPLPPPQADPTRYFLLATTDLGAGEMPALAKPWALGVRTIAVPAYLQTRTLAIRARSNEIAFPDFARWAEPLDQGLTRVLAANLQSLRGVGRVSIQPFRADEPRDWEITVSATACEGTTEGGVRFTARWRLAAPGSATAAASGTYEATGLKWDGHDHGQLAAKLSEAMAGLSRDLAAALPKP